MWPFSTVIVPEPKTLHPQYLGRTARGQATTNPEFGSTRNRDPSPGITLLTGLTTSVSKLGYRFGMD